MTASSVPGFATSREIAIYADWHGSNSLLRWTMVDLLRRSFEIFVKKCWLREIDRAIDRYQKTQKKANREFHVMKALIERYNKLYNENLWGNGNG